MPQINLASEVFRARLIERRRRVFYAFSVAVLLLVLGFWGVPLLLKMRVEERIAGVERDIAGLEAQLLTRQAEVKAIKLFAERLSLLKERLGTHIGWSNVLAELERTTTPLAAFKKLSGSAETGLITADIAVPSLDAAADLIASLQRAPGVNDTFFETVEATGFSADSTTAEAGGSSGYRVGLRLTVPRKAFSLAPGTP